MHNAANRVAGNPKEKLLVQHGECNSSGSPHRACAGLTNTQGGSSWIHINRDQTVKTVRNRSTSDTSDQEMIQTIKGTAQSVIHEMCHFRHPNESDDNLFADRVYFETNKLGQCSRDSYRNIFGEEPPDYLSATGQQPNDNLFFTVSEALEKLGDLYNLETTRAGGINHVFYANDELEGLPGDNRTRYLR